MKKHVLLLIVLCLSLAMQAKNTLVTTKTQFTTAWGTLANGDTITVGYNGGVILNTGAVNLPAAGGLITVRGQSPDSLPILQTEFDGVTLADGVTTGLICENLHLQYRSPDGTSGQVIYFNKKYANMTKLIFRHCEISKTVRSLFRSVKPDSISPTQRWASCGDIEYLEMSNCKVHNTTLTTGNNWPLLYLGHLPVEVDIKNNTFYDLPYMKSIFTMNYSDPNQGRNAIINFENNTVSITQNQGALIATGSYLGQEAQFNFKNNVFMVPNWVNATNVDMSTLAKPKILTARYGLVTASNNLVQGYNSWGSGQSIDTDGQGGFISLDTIPQNTMASLGVNWTDFANPQNGDYSYLFTNPMTTAGSTGGPIGDPRWVLTYKNPRTLVVVSDLATAVVTPAKGVYENATSVTVSASTVVGYTFVNWRDTLGTVISTVNPYKFDITANTKLVAHYDALQARAVTIALKGTNTATYTVTPARTQYYAGDIITTTLNTHAINTFLGWSDGKTNLTRIDTLNADLNVTANFTQLPYMLAWDFSHLTANNATYYSLVSNVALDPLNKGVMNMVLGPDTLAANFGTRNNKFTGLELNNCALRKSFNAKAKPDFLYIKFSTKGKTGLKVSSAISTDNNIRKIQKIEYSLDSINYTTFVTDSMPSDSASLWSKWKTLQGNMPVEAQDKDVVYVRWISDPTSTLYAVASSDKKFEYAYISKIVVYADLDMGSSVINLKTDNTVYTSGNSIYVKAAIAGKLSVYDMLGRVVRSVKVVEGINELTGLKKGIYILQIGNENIKAIL